MEALGGDYELIQITWQPVPAIVTRGHLHLEVPDSLWREVPCGFRKARRDLIGWYRSGDTTASAWRALLESRDPARPGVVVRGATIRIGQHCVLDGGDDDLVITAVAPQGFWGYWTQDLGIGVLLDTVTHGILPNPTGFFCAIRLEA